uniref:HAT C-terminal dimerisation domain-containing protein n=1 Tax=Sinocyclocheilus grahami TaxID=75366 RepID=A0A672QSS6_SINGR
MSRLGRCSRRTDGGSSCLPGQDVLNRLSLLLCSQELLGEALDCMIWDTEPSSPDPDSGLATIPEGGSAAESSSPESSDSPSNAAIDIQSSGGAPVDTAGMLFVEGPMCSLGHTLILPCATEIVKELFGEDKSKQSAKIPLSNQTLRVKNGTTHYEWENDIKEDFLFCKELRTTTTANDIFETLDNFVRSNEINWSDCIGVCTDEAAAMTGRQFGIVQHIKEFAPLAVSMHCFLHREVLATKEMESNLHGVLDVAVKIVNFVNARATNSWLFTALCEEVGADYHALLMHTDMRWLSRGRVLMRLFSLREELRDFLADKRPDLAEILDDDKWLAQLGYLSDIFEAFKRKLHMWKTPPESVTCFSTPMHLLSRQLTLWIRNPFTENMAEYLKAHFSEVLLESFWSEIAEEHPVCHTAAMKVLIPFCTTYLCEAGFSTMTALKTKYRARLTLENDMHLALSKISPRIITLCQQQSSH